MLNFKSVFLVFIVGLFLTACQTIPPRKELSAKEKAVKLAKGGQETSLKLHDDCKEKGKLETFYHMDDAKIRAIELGTNTAQVIYATNYNGSVAYDVKFWLCK
jgi:hypothetical protein